MLSDPHLPGRGRPSGAGQRKLGHDIGEYDEYYGPTVAENHDWWDEDKWEENQYPGYDPSVAMGYYNEYGAYAGAEVGGEWDNTDINLYTMVFKLDDALDPQDLYIGIEFDETSLALNLEAEDIDEQSPAAWRSRPLKIHPEPASRSEKKDAASTTPARTAAVESSICVDDITATPTAHASTASLGSPAGSPLPREAATMALEPGTPQRMDPSSAVADPVAGASGAAAQNLTIDAGSSTAGAQNTGPHSPKIVISNVQLEHLKLKMQALKQKRSIAPIELPPAHDEERTAAEESAPSTSPQKASSQRPPLTVYSNCPGNHGLRLFRTPDYGWWCSVCRKGHPEGAAFYGCRECDYDECEQCAVSPPAANTDSAPAVDNNDSAESTRAPARIKPRSERASREAANQSRQNPPPPPPPPTQGRHPRESSSQPPPPPPPPGNRRDTVAAAAAAAAASAARDSGSSRSDEDVSSTDETAGQDLLTRSPPKKDPRLVLRERRSPPEHWEPREARKVQDNSVKRRALVSERPDVSRSRERSVSEEPLPLAKRRAANALATSNSSEQAPRSSAGSAGFSRASIAARRDVEISSRTKPTGSEDGPRSVRQVSESFPRPRQRGDDFLRRVLQAAGKQARIGAGSGGAPSGADRLGGQGMAEPRATLLPPAHKEPSPDDDERGPSFKGTSPVAKLKPPPSREPPSRGPPQRIRKALEDLSAQTDRKSRRI